MGSKNNPGRFDCYGNALQDEPMFILLGRDPSAPRRVEGWADERADAIAMGFRPQSDMAMVEEARQCAAEMRRWRAANNGAWRLPQKVAELTRDAAAARLDGDEYGKEGSKELFAAMKAAGLVAVFGASDDLMEFRGAIDDEIGCYNGGTAYLTKAGLLTNDCDSDRCPHFAHTKKTAATIKAKWAEDGFSWSYETDIPYSMFVIKEDGENYCQGIVFALADVLEKGDSND